MTNSGESRNVHEIGTVTTRQAQVLVQDRFVLILTGCEGKGGRE